MTRILPAAENVTPKTSGDGKQPAGLPTPETTNKTDAGIAITSAPLDRDTFAMLANDWKQLLNFAQRQLEILTGLNADLHKEITALARREAEAQHLACHDGLTGLANRTLLQDRFHQAKSQAKRHHKPLALLLLDLDKFKQVNDQLGHASGDKLLQAVARRMTQAIRDADTACRYGGDEFVIMLPVIDSPALAATLAAEIGNRLGKPYIIDGHSIEMSVSIGVAVYPGDGETFDSIMKQADLAMYRAKRIGHGTFITEQPQEPADGNPWRNPMVIEESNRLRKPDSSFQNEAMHAGSQPKKH